jgi:hypothetical protein
MIASSRVFEVAKEGGYSAEENLRNHVRMREAIVAWARQARFNFAFEREVRNPDAWRESPRGNNTSLFTPARGLSFQEATNDALAHPGAYDLGCAQGANFCMTGGMLNAMAEIEGITSDTGIGTVVLDDPTDWVPGDEGLVLNTHWDGDSGLDFGQNVIYLGGQQWWGHSYAGPKVQHLTQWQREVASWQGGEAIAGGRNVPTRYLRQFGIQGPVPAFSR